MLMSDALTLDAPRRTKDGYLAVRAKAARTGAYVYSGAEVDPDNRHGLRDQATVHVLRDADQVFDTRSLGSFVGKPITDDHPTEAVTADNWRAHARGIVMGAVKDGDHVGFDLAFLDAATIAKIDAGKAELSNGYVCKLEFGDFTAADGTKCQARQTEIVGNHVALVDRGRAGSTCRVGDAALCDALPPAILNQEKPVKIKIGDAEVDATNGEAVRIAVDALNTKLGALTADLATATTAIATRDGEIAGLNAKLADATVTPQKLQQMADARADVIAKAKVLAPALVADGKSDADIRKEAVTVKLGDTAKDMADAAIEGAFLALTKDAKPTSATVVPIGDAAVIADELTAYHTDRAKQRTAITGAWKTPFNAADAA